MEKIIHGAPFPFMPFKIRRARPEDFAPRSSLVPQPDPRSDRPPISIENGEIKRLYPAVRAQVVSPHRAMLACLARLDGGNLQQRLLASDFLHVERSLMQAKQAIDEVTSPESAPLSTYDVKAQRAPEAFRILYRGLRPNTGASRREAGEPAPLGHRSLPAAEVRAVCKECRHRRDHEPVCGADLRAKGYLFVFWHAATSWRSSTWTRS